MGESTGLLLKVHTSNFRVLGFTHSPAIGELADLAATRGVPLVYDLGSGLLRHIDVEPLTNEPTVSDAIAAGADVVCFSGDKLLCGPQSGILAGKKRYIDRIRENPLFRALRPGKLDLAALEATLLAYRIDDVGSDALPDLPLYRQLALSCDELRRRAERIRGALAHLPVRLEIRKTIGFLGSGSAPAREIESVALAIVAPDLSAAQLADRLRRGTPRVFARIADAEVLVEMRSVFEDQVETLIASLTGALASRA
jgi:L-seryl-tRNA(Ser) seleniumtransferase